MPQITLVGTPRGESSHVIDSETGDIYLPGVSREVDDATVERLRSTEQFGFTFHVGDPAALEVAPAPDPRGPAVAPEVAASAADAPAA